MAETPAWSRDSVALRLPEAVRLEDLTPEWAWGGATGAGVRVAVVDSGVEAAHPALGGRVTRSLEVRDGQVVPCGGDDRVGHGTACAGIVRSLAPDAEILSLRCIGPGTAGSAADFLTALAWCVQQGVEVVNLSLGTTRRDWALAFHEVCDTAYFRGTAVVTAANNLPAPSYPSLFSSVFSVASHLGADPLRFHHNPDPPTEFLARGLDVPVAWRGGGELVASGNSYAAPHVAGLLALVRSKHPQLRPFHLKTVLWATASNVREAPERATRWTSRTLSARATAVMSSVRV